MYIFVSLLGFHHGGTEDLIDLIALQVVLFHQDLHHAIDGGLVGGNGCNGLVQLILQKSGFLAAESTVNLSVHLQKRLGTGFFGGEGFVMQRLSGSGVAFAEFDGHVVEYDLMPGQSIVVGTGNLAAMDATCSMEIQMVPGVKNAIFGGEGLFNTVITGPGRIYLQTMPIIAVANAIRPYIPTKSD